MFRILLIFLVFQGLAVGLPSAAVAQDVVLDSLLHYARQNWPELKQRQAESRIGDARLSEASRVFRPNVNFGTSYTLAAGGRTIDFPIGDLLNPAYGALNQLTQTQNFPQLDNQSIALLPNNFYDARVRITQPIFNPELKLQKSRAEQGQVLAKAQLETSIDELNSGVRSAYYQVQQAQTAVIILQEADTLVAEALRTTRSLVKNGAALPLARERIIAERAQVLAQRATAEAQVQNALAQLSFYVGEDEAQLIALMTKVEAKPLPVLSADDTIDRPELQALNAAKEVAAIDANLEEKWRSPRLGVQLDLGSQDFKFGWNPYALAGLSLDIPLYDGGRNDARSQRLQLEQEVTSAKYEDVANRIDLQLTVARNNYEAALKQLAAYDPAESAAERTLSDAQKLYRNGSTSYLEMLDARTQLTRVRLERNIAFFNTRLRYVAYQRALGQ